MLEVINYLNQIFHNKIIVLILINFLMLVALVFLNLRKIKQYFSEISKKSWLILGVIFFGMMLFRLSLPIYYHLVFIDEHLYLQAAKNIILSGTQGVYSKSIGWPFVLNLFFRVFGINNWVSLYVSAGLGIATIILMFLFVYVLLSNEQMALIAAGVFSFMPLHIRWAATAETNAAALFFVMISMLCALFYFKKQSALLLWLAFMAVAFAAQFRPENYIFFVIFIIGVMIFCKQKIKITSVQFFVPLLLSLFLCSANLWQILAFQLPVNWIASDTGGAMTGSNWSIGNFIYNLTHYAMFFNAKNGVAIIIMTSITLPFVAHGIFLLYKHKKRECRFLLVWWIILVIVYFSSWFQTMARSRFYMSFYPITIVFFVYGLRHVYFFIVSKMGKYFPQKNIKIILGTIIGSLALISLVTVYLQFSASNKYAQKFILETKIPELAEKDLPQKYLILAVLPEVLTATTNLEVMPLDKFLNMSNGRQKVIIKNQKVLFFEDYCALFYQNPKFKVFVNKLNKNFSLKEFKIYQLNEIKYSFYEISLK